MKRYIIIIAAVLGMAAMALCGCGEEDDENDMDMTEESAINVETAYPVIRTISQSGSYMGTIEAGEKVPVTPRVGGYVKTKNYSLGDFVNAGDVLFTIDDSNLLLEKKKAEADVKDANAALTKDKAENESTKFEVNETLNTLNTKSQENNNEIQKAIRSEYEARLDLYKACADESIHKDEGNYLEDLIRKDKDSIENLQAFTMSLNYCRNVYNSIKGAATVDEAKEAALNMGGIDPATIPAECNDQEKIADYYIARKTNYLDIDELDEAIESSTEAVDEARSSKGKHESEDRSNDLSILSDEIQAEKQKGNIATAQADISLKRRLAADYEIFTKARIWAASQAKLAAGDASVLSTNVKLSKAQIDLEIAEQKLKNTNVTSPVSGEIVECKVKDFGLVSDQEAAYTIIDTSRKKAVFYVTGDAKNNMTVGQKVTIDRAGTEYTATVDHISDAPDEKRMLYRITAILSEEDKSVFDAGTSIRVITTIKKSDNAFTIPIGVVYYDEGRGFVYVARNGIAVKTPIETGIDDSVDIEVISGLSADDQVIVNWSEQLQDNAAVNITKTSEKVTVNTPSDDENAGGQTENVVNTEPAESAKSEAPVYVETTANVNIRKDPTVDSEKLITAEKGTRFEKTGQEPGGWTRIKYNDGEAYVSSDYVRECEP